MLLVTFTTGQDERIGVLAADGAEIHDLFAAPGLPRDMVGIIRGGPVVLEAIRSALPRIKRLPAASVRLLAPIPRPGRNIFCVGKNYHEHAKEFHASGFDASAAAAPSAAIPDAPIVFTKAPSTVIGPGETVPAHLDPTSSTDYEGELAVVVAEGGRGIATASAMDHVFGYTIVNDVTARTLQNRHKQWFLGKSIDGFCPMGPAIVTADAVPDVATLRLTTSVNGEPRQNASVADLIFDIPTLIATISAGITLEPGDIIATGTPAGVGIGFNPPRFLRRGDRVAITVTGIGTLENPIG
ncbi:MAG: fumarylacetoacetate hydrolase family protein [Alphaproteobacteria bacterium]|nr:fumarylacetoacetate hydrolase family protein [Alphaproteobacteria bacterium]